MVASLPKRRLLEAGRGCPYRHRRWRRHRLFSRVGPWVSVSLVATMAFTGARPAAAATIAFAGARPATAATAATAGRGSVTPSGPVPVGRAPALPAQAAVQAPVASSLPLNLTVVLRPRDPDGLAALVKAVSTPGTAEYRHYLAPGEFVRRFGPTPATVAAVDQALAQVGLHPGTVSGNGLDIPVAATAGEASTAFGIHLHDVRLASGRVAFANDAAPRLPAAVASYVTAIVGLDSLARATPHWESPPPAGGGGSTTATNSPGTAAATSTGGPQPCPAAASAAQATGAHTADQLARSYSFGGLYSQGDRGAGITVALFELAPFTPSDIAAFQACYGTTAKVSTVAVRGGPLPNAPGDIEVELDIEGVISLAPQAAVQVYEGPYSYGIVDVYNQIVSDDTAQVVSTSWGVCEYDSYSVAGPEQTIFQEAAVQGQTIVAAAGDRGSEDCDGYQLLDALAVDDPASQPLVTGVGGTTLTGLGPAPTETVWNEAVLGLGAGGGGVSISASMPFGQQGPGVVNGYSTNAPCYAPTGTFCRQVPDVSASADPTHGYLIYYSGGGAGSWQAVGGTSGGAPLWAAVMALADQHCACSVGYVNPLLYDRAAQGPGAFNDITSGNNDYLKVNGGAYPATAGYDLASGLGTPVAAALVAGLGQPMAPLYTAASPPTIGTVSVYYGYTFTAAALPAPTFSIAGGTLPPGLSLNGTTGLLSGTPTTTGPFHFAVAVANGIGSPALTAALTLNIVPYVAPVITSAAAVTFTVGVHSTFTVTTTGQPVAALRQDGSLPTGVAFVDQHDGTATISGTPAAGSGGTYGVPVTAANGGPATDFQGVTLTIDEPPAFTAAAPPTGDVNRPYLYRFTTSGYPASTFSVLGLLPPGLSLTADGVLWGTPTTTGLFTVTVTAGNGVGVTAQGLGITVTTVPPGTIFGFTGGVTGYGDGGDGGPALLAGFGQPDAVASDAHGNVYVADGAFGQVRKVRPNGTITGFAGLASGFPGNTGDGGPATSAELNGPTGLAVDTAGDVYIADTGNNRIRKVDTNGTITNYAGSPGSFRGNAGDGGPATAATLYYPTSVAVDAVGNVYIADTGNQRIRRVDTNGIITNFAGQPWRGAREQWRRRTGRGGHTLGSLRRRRQPLGRRVHRRHGQQPGPPGGQQRHHHQLRGQRQRWCGEQRRRRAGHLGRLQPPVECRRRRHRCGTGRRQLQHADPIGRPGRGRRRISRAAPTSFPADAGDGGPATSATFAYPMDAAVDNGGDAFVPIGGTPERVREILGPLPTVFDSANRAAFTVGVAASMKVTADNAPGIAIAETGPLPAGVAFNPATDTLAGTPAQGVAGSYPISFIARGTNGASSTQSFVLTVDQAQFTYPVNGQNNVDPTHPLTWSTIPESQGYIVVVGTKLYGNDLFNSGVLPATISSVTLPALPALSPGQTLYATLLSEVNGAWTSYQAITFSAIPGQATFTFPLDGQRGVDPTRPFTWAPIPAAQGYVLTIGTTRYGANVVNSGILAPTTSFRTPLLPAGTTLYATLFTEVNGTWSHFQAITFTAGSALATLTHPVNGQANLATPDTFTWNPLYAAQAYDLTVGSSPLASNLVNTGRLNPWVASYAIPALPPGRTLYATLYTSVAGKWAYQQVTFTTSR